MKLLVKVYMCSFPKLCVVKKKKEKEIIPGLGTRTDSTLLFSATARFYDIKHTTKLLTFVFLFDYNN